VVLSPAAVQGAQAPRELVAALEALYERANAGEIDVILLVRGGGSLEDLWAFNDEALARAIAALGLPLVTGIGHEVDFTIADLVADLRAPTPSAAAELAVPDAGAWLAALEVTGGRLRSAMRRALGRHHDTYAQLNGRLGRLHPAQALRERMQRLDELQLRLAGTMRREARTRRERLLRVAAELAGQSPATRLAALGQRIGHAGARLLPALRGRIAGARGLFMSAARGLDATRLCHRHAGRERRGGARPGRSAAGDRDRGATRAGSPASQGPGPLAPAQRFGAGFLRSRVRRCRGVSFSRRFANGLTSLRRSTRTGVPSRRNASRKQFIR
jgi:exonuclease VII large subunit